MEATEEYRGWRHEWATISNWLFELDDDHNHNLPGWLVSFGVRTSLFVIDPIIDISRGHFPGTWKCCWPKFFVDDWHADCRGGNAPYGKIALRARADRLTRWLRVPRNLKSMMLRQK